MFLKLYKILEDSHSFQSLPSKKDEKWRFASLNSYLDREYKKDVPDEKDTSFSTEDEYWLYIKDGQLQDHRLPSYVHIKQRPLAYEVTDNPFACMASNEALSPLELILYEDVELGLYFDYSNDSFITSSLNIILKENIKAGVYIDYGGGEKSFISHSSHIQVQPYARLNVTQNQNLASQAAFITQNSYHLQENAYAKAFTLLFGGEYLHNFINMDLGFNSEADISSLLLSKDTQILLFSCDIEQLADRSKSSILSKQVLKDGSTCVFDANTCIHAKTKATQAEQSSRALLLDETAQIHSKPHLEIYSDDLKASHGSTVGELDIEAISYLVLRGISEFKAKEILISAFVNETIQKIDEVNFKDRILATLGESYEQR
ncbi:SufD family Fe-S cluster assembly protein [Campylobacterota bacterium]